MAAGLLGVPTAGAAVTHTVTGSELKVTGDTAANAISVYCDAGNTTVQDHSTVTHTSLSCSALSRLEVTGSDGNDLINLQGVTEGSGFTNAVLSGNIFAEGDAGSDSLTASRDLLSFLYGGAGLDRIFGREGNDSISGGAGPDIIKGKAGSDFIQGNSGGDNLIGGTGIDFILGGAGRDSISGGGRIDCLRGGGGADVIASGPGRDSVGGGPGRDRINQGPPPGDTFSARRCSAAAL